MTDLKSLDSMKSLRVDTRLGLALKHGVMSRDCLVAGPAGTGKTYAILKVIHRLAVRYPGLRILICRQTRASLTQSALVTFEQEILVRGGMASIASGAKRRTRQSYIYPNGTEIALAGLDNPGKVLSSAWDVVYVNEATETTEEAWETLQTRLRRPGRPTRLGYLIADTNPADPGHWLKRRADKGLTTLWDTTFEANPALHDGAGWTDAGRAYIANLDRLTGSRRKRLRDGLWAAGEGAWFDGFDTALHVSERAVFDPSLPVHVGLDSGHESAATWFQVATRDGRPEVRVLADYYSMGRGALKVAEDVVAINGRFGHGRWDVSTDPAGKSATGVGVSVFGEFERAGLRFHPWPIRSVLDSLSLLESFISVDPPELIVHPSCRRLIDAFANYRRAQRQKQWIDRPVDPQHPHEDVIDALRGGLCDVMPAGRRPAVKPLGRVKASTFIG